MIVVLPKKFSVSVGWAVITIAFIYAILVYTGPSVDFASDTNAKHVAIVERLLQLEEYKVGINEKVVEQRKQLEQNSEMISNTLYNVWELKEDIARIQLEHAKKLRITEPKGLSPKGRDIVLVTGYTSDDDSRLIKIRGQMRENRQAYCDRHGYSNLIVDLDPYKSLLDDYVPYHWLKLYAVKEAFERFPEAKWVLWIDADVLIMNQDIELAGHILNNNIMEEKLMYDSPIAEVGTNFTGARYHSKGYIAPEDIELIVSHDTMGLNVGLMMFRRSEYTMTTLMDMWLTKENMDKMYVFPEQDILTEMVLENKNGLFYRFGIAPTSLINTYWEDYWVPSGRYHEGDFMCHFPGMGGDHEGLDAAWSYMWARLHREEHRH